MIAFEQLEICDVPMVDPAKVDRVKRSLTDEETNFRLSEIFGALSDATRLRIIDALSREELCVCDISAALGLSQSATSHQLRTLRQLRLVRQRREGRLVFYSLDDDHILGLFKQGLAHVLEEMPAHLSQKDGRP